MSALAEFVDDIARHVHPAAAATCRRSERYEYRSLRRSYLFIFIKQFLIKLPFHASEFFHYLACLCRLALFQGIELFRIFSIRTRSLACLLKLFALFIRRIRQFLIYLDDLSFKFFKTLVEFFYLLCAIIKLLFVAILNALIHKFFDLLYYVAEFRHNLSHLIHIRLGKIVEHCQSVKRLFRSRLIGHHLFGAFAVFQFVFQLYQAHIRLLIFQHFFNTHIYSSAYSNAFYRFVRVNVALTDMQQLRIFFQPIGKNIRT